MAKINLLPWRAERRKQRQKEFYGMLFFAAIGAVLLGFAVVQYFNHLVDVQNQRNTLLTEEISKLDAAIKEIEALDKRKAELLARKAVIEQLQSSRSQMVHLFDELVRTIPDGVRLNSIKQTGDKLTLDGVAQSNARVSSYMLQLEESGWMTSPDLGFIEAKGLDKSMPYQFALTVTLKKPKKEGEVDDESVDDSMSAGGAP